MSDDTEKLPAVEVDLIGQGSRIRVDGMELGGVRDIHVHQPLEGPPIVTVEFFASSVKGWSAPRRGPIRNKRGEILDPGYTERDRR